jgi:hypothetical protein
MSKEINSEANSQLRDDLRGLKLGYRPTKGSYTSLEDKKKSEVPTVEENSFIVNNISMESAIKLGTKYEQESIIYAETGNVAEDGSIAMTFRLIGTDKTKPKYGEDLEPSKKVFINRNNEEDFYSRIGDRKFMIPFFGVTEHLVDRDGKYVYKDTYDKDGNISGKERVAKKQKDYTDSKWDGGAVSPLVTTVIKDKDGKPMSDEKIKELENSLKDGKWEEDDVIKNKDDNPMDDEKIEELENRINQLAESCVRWSGNHALSSRRALARLLDEHQDYIKFVE